MARKRKGPWRRKQDQHWYTTIGRKLAKVADKECTYEKAFQEYAKIVSQPHEPPARVTIGILLNSFVDWTQSNRAEATYQWYRRFRKSFVQHTGVSLKVQDVKPYHVQDWLSLHYKEATRTTQNGAIRALQRAFNWGVNNGRIDRNPIVGIEKPSREPREFVITEAEFQELLGFVNGQEFKDYLCFMWETGCRPQEIKLIERKHREGNMIILERKSSKGKKYNRVIYLNQAATEILGRLKGPGPLFRNSQGKPWTANSVRCRFRTLKKKMNMPELCANTMRHSWATNSLKNGTDTTTASILMGHRDPSTLIRNYQHLAKDHEYLAKAAETARQGVVVPLPLVSGTSVAAQV